MGLLKEFKDFAFKGNVIDMAVGVIIGGAFTSVVSGITENILQPIVTLALDHSADGLEAWKNSIPASVGALTSSIVTFLLTALVLFLMIKGIRTAEEKAAALTHKDEAAPAPTTKVCPYCKSEIPIDAVKCCHCTSDVK